MSLHVSRCENKIKKNMKSYCIGKSIILPHVRYIDNGKRDSLMYHSQVVSSKGHCYTLGCNRMGVSGLCSGHKISREDFLKKYCNGIEPEMNTNKE